MLMGVHDGHRKRLKARYTETGITGLRDHEMLELLLTYAIPRRDVNELAHELIERFGSLDGVLSADISQLASVNGVSEHTAILIRLVRDTACKATIARCEREPLVSVGAAMEYCYALMAEKRTECPYAIMLDERSRIIRTVCIGDGTHDTAMMSVREVVIAAVDSRASAVVLTHNHPSGSSEPSVTDIATTNNIAIGLNTIGLNLWEHIIVGRDSCTAIMHKQTRKNTEFMNLVQFKRA